MHGRGVYVWPSGQSYEGEYKADLKDGYGSYRWKDGRRYIGDWKNNKRHGRGYVKDVDGRERSGVWENDKRVSWDDPFMNKVQQDEEGSLRKEKRVLLEKRRDE